jgi:hypothetical protein
VLSRLKTGPEFRKPGGLVKLTPARLTSTRSSLMTVGSAVRFRAKRDEDRDKELLGLYGNHGEDTYPTCGLRIPRWLLEGYLYQVRV